MNNHPIYPYPDTLVSAAETRQEHTPVTPLPNPGEGGPVYDGSEPAIPLPNPGEGGQVFDGAEPVIPLPNPGEGGPVFDGPGWNTNGHFHTHFHPPVFRPIFPAFGSSITVIPGISFPCYNCTASGNFGRVRVLNASTRYQPFNVSLGGWMIAGQLANGDITSYVQAASGRRTMTISGANGYVYIQKSITIRPGASMTVAIINTASGLDLKEISDASCSAPSGSACLRTCNLSLNLGPFDVTLENSSGSYTPFTNVAYKNVTSYATVYPNWYQIYISRTGSFPGNAIAAASATLEANVSYTLYLFNAPTATEGLRAMIVSN